MEAWLEPESIKNNRVIKELQKKQSSSLRVIAGAYKATKVRELETETFTPPIDIYCKERYTAHIQPTYTSQTGEGKKAILKEWQIKWHKGPIGGAARPTKKDHQYRG
jgi:hypothetical protein